MTQIFRYDVFISYSSKDVVRAEIIHAALERAGYSVWRDKKRLEPNRTYSRDIAAAQRASKCVLVLWSANAIHSDWVKDEARLACAHEKMVPVMLDGTQPPEPFHLVNATPLLTGPQILVH